MDKIANLPETKQIGDGCRNEPGITSTLLVGGPGTAKTSCILMYTMKFDLKEQVAKRMNFSFATTPQDFQEGIDGSVVKKTSKKYAPEGDKKMTIFIDDVSMP